MGDPNGNETLSSSTAIGKIYPVSLTVLRFAVIAFRIQISFQNCPSNLECSFKRSLIKQILKLLKLTQTRELYLLM